MLDYSKYEFSIKELIFYILIGSVGIFIITWVFFKSMIISLLCLPLVKFYLEQKRKQLCKNRKDELIKGFVDMLNSINISLKVSSSLEKSFFNAMNEMEQLHGINSNIYKELKYIVNKMKVNVTIDSALEDFAIRSDIKEIIFFSHIISSMKKRGGNVILMINNSISTIISMLETKNEVNMILSGKINEKRVMDKFPIGIIVYMTFTSGEILEPLYTTIFGRIIMFFALIFYIIAYYWGEKIINIRI